METLRNTEFLVVMGWIAPSHEYSCHDKHRTNGLFHCATRSTAFDTIPMCSDFVLLDPFASGKYSSHA